MIRVLMKKKTQLDDWWPPNLPGAFPKSCQEISEWHGNNTVSCYVCAAMIRLLQFGAAPLPFSQLAAGWKFIDLSAVKKSNYIIQLLLMHPNVAFCDFVFDMCCFFLYIISLSQCRWHKAALFLWCQGTNRSYRVISRYWVIKSEDFSLECISALWVVP